jgi:hypothetical protein
MGTIILFARNKGSLDKKIRKRRLHHIRNIGIVGMLGGASLGSIGLVASGLI